jgi:hypothetical protein
MWPAPVARSVDVQLVIVLLAVALVVVIAVVLVRRNRSTNSVDSFRRHIDALSPEARRTTVDQVQNAASRSESTDESTDPPANESPSAEDDTDEGGARGT